MFNFVTDIFKNTATRFPDKTAVADENESLSFAQLCSLSEKIASCLSQTGANIGVMVHRDIYTVPMFFGVSLCGNCYVPLDPDMPEEKLSKIVESAGIETVLSFKEEDGEKLSDINVNFLCLNKELPCRKINSEYAPCSLLYLVYTSGSTGTPKGVAKSHSAMKSFADAYIKEFGFDENTVIGNQTPFYFDASAKDIYLMATTGATLEIIPTKLFSFPVKLVEYMNERKINFISWVPSALTIVTALGTFSEIKPEYLKRVCFVGEAFASKHLNKWMDALPQTEFVNLYGSSEICGVSCFYRIPAKIDEDKNIPIGSALSNCEVRLFENGKPAAEKGEIYVSSDALADCYYGDADKTKESFVLIDGKRFYRTGDIARCDENGNLEFLSRSDFQIKHMGHRIELGEIETAALSMAEIDKCCCVYDKKRSRIILHIQPKEDTVPELAKVRAHLKEKLSEYMLPHRIKIWEALPANRNGKIDRAALAALN